jgi:hypothetical protein
LLKPRRKAFDSLVVLIVWCIWMEHNARVFRNQAGLVSAVVATVFACCDLWCRANLAGRSQLVM